MSSEAAAAFGKMHATTSQFRAAGSGDDTRILPPVLYLPMHGETTEGPIADVRELPDGRRALVAYTALDRLARQCGENQPWMLVAIEALAEIKGQNAFDTVAFDPKSEAHLRENGRLL